MSRGRGSRSATLLFVAVVTAVAGVTRVFAQAQPQAHSQPSGFAPGAAQATAPGNQPAASKDSFRFNQPIPVNIRKSNNAVIQMMLLGIDLKSISVMSPQGRTFEYANNTVRSVRSFDGSFFYAPNKDNPAEMISRLNQLQPANSNPAEAAAGQPAPASTAPFTVTGAQPSTTAAHSQPMPATGFGNSGQGLNGGTAAPAAAHSPASPTTAHTQAPFTTSGAHSQSPMPTTTTTMPAMSHSPASPMPSTTPATSHGANPGHFSPAMVPQTATTMWEYECSKCHHRFTSPTEIKAGHRCVKCGVVWGQVQDQNGRVMSSSPAARAGSAVGLIVVVAGIIAAIVRKVQSA